MRHLIFVIGLILAAQSGFSQNQGRANSVFIYPPFPTINDSVYLVIQSTNKKFDLSSSLMMLNDSIIDIKTTYKLVEPIENYHRDTLNLGFLPIGDLAIRIVGHERENKDSIFTIIFTNIADFPYDKEEVVNAIRCFPYPYIDEELNIRSPFEIAKLEIMSGAGHYYMREKINLKKELKLNVGELATGGYYLLLYDQLGEQYRVRFYVR